MTSHLTRVKITATIYVDVATESHPEDIDDSTMKALVEGALVDYLFDIGNVREAAESMIDSYDFADVKQSIACSICGKDTDADTAHLHQGEYIGEECWDDRLHASE
jgi:hypothetical protein